MNSGKDEQRNLGWQLIHRSLKRERTKELLHQKRTRRDAKTRRTVEPQTDRPTIHLYRRRWIRRQKHHRCGQTTQLLNLFFRCVLGTYFSVYVCVHVNGYVFCLCICAYVYVYVDIYVNVNVNVYVCSIYVYICICLCICICLKMYLYICVSMFMYM